MLNRFSRDTGRMDDIIPTCINATSLVSKNIYKKPSYIPHKDKGVFNKTDTVHKTFHSAVKEKERLFSD